MEKLTFTTVVNAPKERVWFCLWNQENYNDWTSLFCEGSHAVSDWKESSIIYFLAPNGDGMYSKIAKLIPSQTMIFHHTGEMKDFKLLSATDDIKSWSGSEERYDLSEKDGITTVTTTVDVVATHLDYFKATFPKALDRLKKIVEAGKINSITVNTAINQSIENVWAKFNNPQDVIHWNFASDDWHCPKAVNNLEVGEQFVYTMASKDRKISFDFVGTYSVIEPNKKIAYTIEDGRKVTITFQEFEGKTLVSETFEPENIHSIELQQAGWQSILDNFKKYTEQ